MSDFNAGGMAVACVTAVFEKRDAGGSILEAAQALRELVEGLDAEETRAVLASAVAWLCALLPDEPDEARAFLRSAGLQLSE